MADILTRAQLSLLADLLQTDTARLSSLERLGADDLKALRGALSDALFDEQAEAFARVGRLAPLVPNALVVTVAQRAVPPEVAGRVGGAVGLAHSDRAIGVLSGLKPTYLADAAPYVDPRVIPHFAPRLPAKLLIPAAKELLRRRDYLTASRFVEFATEEHIVAFEKAIDDDEGIILTGVLVSDTAIMNDIMRAAGPDRALRMARTAAQGNSDVLAALLSLLNRIDPELARPAVAELLGHPDAERVTYVLDVAVSEGVVLETLEVSAALDGDALTRLTSLEAWHRLIGAADSWANETPA
ncbi:hypothetical protein [Mycolicibacterium phocaicum]|jgi:hypothetical protein|uniref:Uncharacterized protein n=1 Tax=Mycolicibacterium phocaicum TaxID=319706 RepID=A0A7I7ZSI6_9MYCO|nr:hypothetical protein [Mycolicibacterium phocaicum]TLH59472.1 hypothetical protein C1S79_27270 [Mycolicibacterium phocaicum]UCZ60593.1 hypothetical protein LHJ73_28905 [Mycolicibacterium phocaicum]BBZ56762.1 hypothetical protein MPHO_37540 [Mycolicibacterium phocaicum]